MKEVKKRLGYFILSNENSPERNKGHFLSPGVFIVYWISNYLYDGERSC